MLERNFIVIELPDASFRNARQISLKEIFNDEYSFDDVLFGKNGVRFICDIVHNRSDSYIDSVISSGKTAWLFQWNSGNHNVFEDFTSARVTDPFRVNAQWERMKRGDVALLWKTKNEENHATGEAGFMRLADC